MGLGILGVSMTGMIVSYKTFTKIEGKSAYYFFPDDTNEIIALEPLPYRWVPDGIGYIIVNDSYIEVVRIK